MRPLASVAVALVALTPSIATAGTILAKGNVVALQNVAEMGPIMGTANFDEGPTNGPVPVNTYTPMGMTFHKGLLSQILPGVTTMGGALGPNYATNANNYFPMTMGGGVQALQIQNLGGVATFTGPVTRVGLTASKNGKQYLTVWDTDGVMIGQVDWAPLNDSSFVGIDTMGVPIGMFAFGNDDLWSGATYEPGGLNIYSDTWVWALGEGEPQCGDDADCDDKDACNGEETCLNALCLPGTPPVCSDDDPCTDNACDPLVGCTVDPVPGCCTDRDDCAPDEFCEVLSNLCVPNEETSSDPGTGESSTAPGETGVSTDTDTTAATTDSGDTDPTTDSATTATTTTTSPSDPTTNDSTSSPATGDDDSSPDTDPHLTTAPTTTGDDASTTASGTGETGDETTSSATAGEGATDGCACTTSSPTPLWLLMLPLLAPRRRR